MNTSAFEDRQTTVKNRRLRAAYRRERLRDKKRRILQRWIDGGLIAVFLFSMSWIGATAYQVHQDVQHDKEVTFPVSLLYLLQDRK